MQVPKFDDTMNQTLISALLDQKWMEYDDVVRQLTLAVDKREKQEYTIEAREILSIISELLAEYTGEYNKIYTEKVQ